MRFGSGIWGIWSVFACAQGVNVNNVCFWVGILLAFNRASITIVSFTGAPSGHSRTCISSHYKANGGCGAWISGLRGARWIYKHRQRG